MTIKVNLDAHLRQYLPVVANQQNDNECKINEGTTINEMLSKLGFPPEVKLIIVINDFLISDMARILKDGDTLNLYPVMMGG
jgi:sulfur carrier protein ThiS